jgi:DNA-binding NarL/FixJ family response regulator
MYEDERFVYHLMENGANGYMLKNAEPNEIRRVIMEVCEPYPVEEITCPAKNCSFAEQ